MYSIIFQNQDKVDEDILKLKRDHKSLSNVYNDLEKIIRYFQYLIKWSNLRRYKSRVHLWSSDIMD